MTSDYRHKSLDSNYKTTDLGPLQVSRVVCLTCSLVRLETFVCQVLNIDFAGNNFSAGGINLWHCCLLVTIVSQHVCQITTFCKQLMIKRFQPWKNQRYIEYIRYIASPYITNIKID